MENSTKNNHDTELPDDKARYIHFAACTNCRRPVIVSRAKISQRVNCGCGRPSEVFRIVQQVTLLDRTGDLVASAQTGEKYTCKIGNLETLIHPK